MVGPLQALKGHDCHSHHFWLLVTWDHHEDKSLLKPLLQSMPSHVLGPRRSILLVLHSRIAANQYVYPLVMTKLAMENDPFIDDFPSYKPPFIREFAMLKNKMVYIYIYRWVNPGTEWPFSIVFCMLVYQMVVRYSY